MGFKAKYTLSSWVKDHNSERYQIALLEKHQIPLIDVGVVN